MQNLISKEHIYIYIIIHIYIYTYTVYHGTISVIPSKKTNKQETQIGYKIQNTRNLIEIIILLRPPAAVSPETWTENLSLEDILVICHSLHGSWQVCTQVVNEVDVYIYIYTNIYIYIYIYICI